MIMTITMNPAIDKSTTLEKLIPDKKLRCSALVKEAGGGGVNVGKAIHRLGGDCLVVFTAGGTNGKLLEELLLKEGIRGIGIPVAAETRENFMITEQTDHMQYRFVLPGDALSLEEVESCLDTIKMMEVMPSIIIASGSLPPGVPEDFFARLARLSKTIGAKFIVDTSGIPLQMAVKEGVYLLKPNLSELSSLAGKAYLQLDEVEAAARKIIAEGHCEVLVVSMGPAGALLITQDQYVSIPAPIVKRKSTVGAGDGMVGGMAWMMEQGGSLLEMVRFGVACGTAATMNPGTQLFHKEDALELYKWLGQVNQK